MRSARPSLPLALSITLTTTTMTSTLGCGPDSVSADEVGSASETSSATGTDTSALTSTDETTGNMCAEVWIEPEYVFPNLLILVDASSSMVRETWDDDGDPLTPEVTRWSSARKLVKQVVDGLDATTHLGVQRFPAAAACPNATLDAPSCSDADACLVDAEPEVPVGPDQGDAIFASLPGSSADAIEIAGGSPAAAAFSVAHDHLLPLAETSYSAILLITDGAPNCGQGLSLPESLETYDASLVAQVDAAFSADQIPTYVVGVDVQDAPTQPGFDSPATNPFTTLNELALAGGMPQNFGMDPQKFYTLDEPQTLLDAFPPFADDYTCTIDLTMTEAGAPDPELVDQLQVFLDDSVYETDDCANEDGWAWIVKGEIMSFCGADCGEFAMGAPAHIIYGCGESA